MCTGTRAHHMKRVPSVEALAIENVLGTANCADAQGLRVSLNVPQGACYVCANPFQT